MKKKNKHPHEVRDYDEHEVTDFLDLSKPLKFEHLKLKLPPHPPTQVVSIRLPSGLLNEIKAIGSQQDVPYQALIKLFLAEGVSKTKKKSA